MSYAPPPDEQNPYAAPQSDLSKEKQGWEAGGIRYSGAPVRFAAVGEAWNIMKQQWGKWILISLVFLVVYGGINFALGFVGQMIVMSAGGGDMEAMNRASTIWTIVSFPISVLINSYLYGGLYIAAIKQLRGQPFGVEDIFGASRAIVPLFVGNILVALATFGGLILLIIPGIYIACRLALVIPLIVDAGLSGTEAMKASWRALGGNVGTMFGVLFCAGLLSILGALLCGIGVILTMPVTYLAVGIVYRDLFLAKPIVPAGGDWPELT